MDAKPVSNTFDLFFQLATINQRKTNFFGLREFETTDLFVYSSFFE